MIDIFIIFIVNFFLRIITVMTGGGGMIVLPMLIFFGLSPAQAIATNRMGSQFVNISILKFHKEGKVKWKIATYFIIPTIIGSVLGAMLAVDIDQELFKKLLGFVILISLPLFFYKKEIGLVRFEYTRKKLYLGMVLAVFASFLGGMFASTGVWLTYLYLFVGLDMLQATGTRKITGMVIGLSSLLVFVPLGLVVWKIAVALAFSSALGGWIGAGLGLKAGNLWVKRLFALAVIAGALKMVFF